MTTNTVLFESQLPQFTLVHRGKVRDLYQIDTNILLIVTTDRLSAFDVVLPTAIPKKGEILTSISNFWLKQTRAIINNQLQSSIALSDIINQADDYQQLKNRAMVVKKCQPLPVEAIVRGFLVGSGWHDYQETRSVCGIQLPENLQLASQLPQAIYTPSTKAAVGAHDQNISFETTIDLLGLPLASQVRDISIKLYQFAFKYAWQRGIIIADTKFEFGLDENQQLVLIDEVLTPDSSRFWPKTQYQVGISPPSFDKQFIRDYLLQLAWDKKPPAPELPDHIVEKTAGKYQEAKDKLLN